MHEDHHQAASTRSTTLSATMRRGEGTEALAAGTSIERFDIVDLVGASTSGFVYLAFDRSLGRHIALREYLPRSVATRAHGGAVQPAAPEQAALFAAGLRSFASEALVLARLESASLVKVLRYWEGNGTGYAAMPFYEGTTLRHAVQERSITIDDVSLRALLAQLLDAVEAVHRAQSVHGNISPSDILIRADGRPLLLEFDAARTLLAEMTDTAPATLKPGYAPIELYPGMSDTQPGAWSDVYALAAVAYFLIAGKAPPPAPTRLAHDHMRSAREAGDGKFSAALLETIDRALSVHPEQRPPSAASMRELIAPQHALAVFPQGASNAREAIRREREMLAAQVAHAPPPEPPLQPAFAAAPPTRSQAERRPVEPAPAEHGWVERGRVERDPAPAMYSADAPPLQGEWRRQAMIAERRQFAPRRRRLPALLIGAGMLCTGIATGVLLGYPELILPDAERPATRIATPDPAGAAATGATEAMQPEAAPPETPALSSAATVEPAPAAPAVSAPAPPPPAEEPRQKPAQANSAGAATATTPPARPGTATQAAAPAAPRTGDVAGAAQSKQREQLAAAEQEEWRIASAIGDPEFYETYLKRFPDGPNAAAARARLAAARQAKAPPVPERPAASSATTPAGSGVPVEERSARPLVPESAAPPRTPEVPRAPAASMSAAPAAEAVASASRRTIRSEGQTLSGDFNADPDSGALSGVGQVVWNNGDRYEGKLVNGSKEGKGQFVWSNGQRYNGDWTNNQPNGKGSIVFADGNRYEGEVRNGLPNGRGVLVFSTGSRYEGEVHNGVPHGRGVMVFADGTRYEGEVRDGLPHGQGVTRFRNGDVYSGAVAKGRSHGQGRFSWTSGVVWEGEFRDGQRTNNGRIIAQAKTLASSGAGGAQATGVGE